MGVSSLAGESAGSRRVRALFGVLIMCMSCAAGAAQLRDVRVWASPDGTRIVVDLEGTQRATSVAAKIDGKGLVQRVRSAQYNGGALRVVLDLNQPVKSK